ncbi:MAG: acylphosphatase [Gammaproteobacteria bacterium]|nr:acylphosphatase [Gammaproteobacteria bacterium]
MRTAARLFTVHGRVQGVWFRDSTRREAERLGIAGYAINLPDGNVEVLACGEPAALRELQAWLHRGPPMAQVTQVDVAEVEQKTPAGFRTG